MKLTGKIRASEIKKKILSDKYNSMVFSTGEKSGIYLVGGYIRGILLGKKSFDRDFVIKGDLDDFHASYKEFFSGEILGKKKYIRDLSSGNQKKVGIAAALMAKPNVLILDEPFNSLDPTTQIRLKNLLKVLQKDKNVTILISSHDLNHVTEVCERIVVLHEGEVAHDIQTKSDTLKVLEDYFAI